MVDVNDDLFEQSPHELLAVPVGGGGYTSLMSLPRHMRASRSTEPRPRVADVVLIDGPAGSLRTPRRR
jgi:hypothetical protein